jgi:hypothetical protein
MNEVQKLFLLFFFMCIPLRLAFVYLAKNYTNYLPLIGVLSSIAVVGWISNFYFNTRTKGILGQEVWWNNMRPVHIFLYIIFTILAFNKNKSAWVIGLLDVIIGITAFLMFHYSAGNFKKLVDCNT